MFFALLSKKKTLQEINHKFLEPGHTHMECDDIYIIYILCNEPMNQGEIWNFAKIIAFFFAL